MISGTSARLLLALLVVGILLLASPAYADVALGSVVNVSHSRNSGTTEGRGSLAVNGAYVYAVWVEERNTGFFSRSANFGATFSAPTTFSSIPKSGGVGLPKVASFGQNVYIAWSQSSQKATGIYFKRSTDNGVTFGSAVQLRGSGSVEGIAVSGSNVYIVSTAYTGTLPDVIMARSEDSGATFFPWVNLSMTSAQGTPRIVAEDSNVYVVWVEPFSQPFKVVFRRSQNSGATFEDKIQVSTNTTTSAVRPALAASDSNVNNVNVAYTQGGQVYIAKLATGGLTFGPPTQLSTESCSVPPCSHDSANIAAAGMDDVHVTWRTANVGADGNDLAYLSYTRSIDGGVNYYAPQTVAQNLKNGDLAANGLNVYISWNDNAEVYMVHSSDRGNSFEPWINISNSSGASGPFTVTVATPNEIHLTWGDSTPGNQDAFYRRGTVP